MACRNSRRRARGGYLLLEATIGLAMLAGAAAAVVQLATLASRANRLTHQMQMVDEQLADWAEAASVMAWDDLTAEKLSALPLSADVRHDFPESAPVATVTDEPGDILARRITFTWQPTPHFPPAALTLWRYPPETNR